MPTHPFPSSPPLPHQELNKAWSSLKQLAAERHERLSSAKHFHAFTRDADEIASRISEKSSILAAEDYGKDLASVMALQRRHEAFERDLAALGDGVAALAEDARRVATAFPEQADEVGRRDEAVAAQWDALTAEAAQRKAKLDDAKDLQRFLNDMRTSLSWISDMKALVSADEPAKDVAGAEALLQRHQEHRDEIQARQESFATATEFGNSLVLRGHYAAEELQEKLDQLRDEREALDQLWQERQKPPRARWSSTCRRRGYRRGHLTRASVCGQPHARPHCRARAPPPTPRTCAAAPRLN